jgi:hypothetical protein
LSLFWAPPADGNDTGSHVSLVAPRLAVAPGQEITVEDPTILAALIVAITQQKQGRQPFPAAIVAATAVAAMA